MTRRHAYSLALIVGSMTLGFVACSDDDEKAGATSPDAATTDATSGADGDTKSDASATDGANSDAATTDSATTDAQTNDAAADASDASQTLEVALVYAGRFNNIDQRLATATLGSDGRILGYNAGAVEAPMAATVTIDGIFSDSFAGASRWTNGTFVGPFNANDGGTIPANDGQHLGIAKVPSVNLPASGNATYALVSATKPTLANGAVGEGTVTAGALSAQFAGNAGTVIGWNLTVTMPDGTFDVVGNGGAANVGDAGGTFGGDAGFRFAGHALSVTTDAGSCAPDAGACPSSGTSRIVFSGANAERIVIAYVIGSGSLSSNRRGVAVFEKQ